MAIRRRPSRTSLSRAGKLVSTFSLAFAIVIAILTLCPVTVKADEDKKAEYGAVIGIGEFMLSRILYVQFSPTTLRLGNNVRDVYIFYNVAHSFVH